MAPKASRESSMPNDGQNNAHPSPTEALKVRWPRFEGVHRWPYPIEGKPP